MQENLFFIPRVYHLPTISRNCNFYTHHNKYIQLLAYYQTAFHLAFPFPHLHRRPSKTLTNSSMVQKFLPRFTPLKQHPGHWSQNRQGLASWLHDTQAVNCFSSSRSYMCSIFVRSTLQRIMIPFHSSNLPLSSDILIFSLSIQYQLTTM
jgi:hypothetical protein